MLNCEDLSLSLKEKHVFSEMEAYANRGYEICQELKRLALEENTFLSPEKRTSLLSLIPNSEELYSLLESYQKRYLAAHLLIEDEAKKSKSKTKAPVLKLVIG